MNGLAFHEIVVSRASGLPHNAGMKRAHILSLILFVALGAAGCKRLFGPRTLEVKPAASARAVVLGIGVVPSLDRSFERAGAVASQLGLPMDAKSMREKTLAGLKVPAAVLAGVDSNAPLSMVLLPPGPKPKEPVIVLAATLKSVEAGQQIRQALGQPVAKQLDAESFKLEDGTSIWLWQKERTLVSAERVEDIIAGAALAMESLQNGAEDLKIAAFPAAIAASQGTDLKTWQAKVIKDLQEANKANPAADKPEMMEMGQRVLGLIFDRVSEMEEVGLTVGLDANRGGSIVFSVVPKKGTLLASLTSKGGAYKLDGAVLGAGEPFMVGASSAINAIPEMWGAFLPILAKLPKGAELAKLSEPLAQAFTGATSMAAYAGKEGWAHAVVAGLSAKTQPATYLDQTAAIWNSPALTGFYEAIGLGIKLTSKREGEVLLAQMKLDPKSMAPEQVAAMKAIYTEKFDMAVTARDHQAYMTMGPGARERLKAMTGGAATQPTGELAAAVKETAGAGAFIYFDLVQFVRSALSASPAGAAMTESPMFTNLRLPIWLSFRGGERASVEMRLPMTSLRSVGAVVPLIMGMGMGMGAAGGQ